jgi:CelD/BcsL family acetyltransferase involved in cellulose biosynthesis
MLLVPGTRIIESNRCTARVVALNSVPDASMDDWRALANEAAEPNAFGEAWFMAPALADLRRGRTVRITEVRDVANRLLGVLPLAHSGRYGRIPVQHVSNWTHYQCFMGTPLVRRGAERPFWLATLGMLDGSDWASGFLSVRGLLEGGPVHLGLQEAATSLGRPCPTVHRYERAALATGLSANAYLEANVRQKKRKELRRLANRLGEIGAVCFSTLEDEREISPWCDQFLTLEAAGWKGTRGSAFANDNGTAAFFRNVIAGAFFAGKLDFQRLDLDGRAIAMLVNFRTPPGSWSFKIAYDEDLARFSPGVLIELENLPRVIGDPDIDWMDSCAVEDHPMINSLWGERRTIVQVSVPLSGLQRKAIYSVCRTAEKASAKLRKMMAQ